MWFEIRLQVATFLPWHFGRFNHQVKVDDLDPEWNLHRLKGRVKGRWRTVKPSLEKWEPVFASFAWSFEVFASEVLYLCL